MNKKYKPYLLLLPQILLTLLFLVGILRGLSQSVGWGSLEGNQITLKYYKELFLRDDFVSSLFFSVKIAGISSLLSVVVGTILCALMVHGKKTKGLYLRLLQIPIVVPHMVVALFVIHLLSQNGLLGRLAFHLHLLQEQSQFPLWVFDRQGVGIIVSYLWKEIPFIIYFVIALMAGIDSSLGEAATNLGASATQRFLKITVPLTMPAILSGFMILFAFSFGAYELPFLLGATLPKALPILGYLEYSNPNLHHRPYAMAINGIIIMVTLAVAIIYFQLLKSQYQRAFEKRDWQTMEGKDET